ncbi:MAG: tryptophan synthase subunit alpha [Clostridiales bacterium]|nr:tryptophan synthase subunit alpha [Clostridiales bacterium]
MNKTVANAFDHGKAFIGFVTAGDPNLETSEEIMLKMAQAGCDLIEIGIPFSDPIAEGPVIQEADLRTLSQGVTTNDVFELTKRVAAQTDIPLVYMTYLNVLYKYGYDKFLKNAKEAGMCGVIIPDMPFEEKDDLQSVAKNYGIEVISFIAPTSENRIKMIASQAEGFVYAVSSLGVTGTRSEITTDLETITKHIKEATDIPVAIGFGINTPEQAKKYANIADGIIIGSAIVKIVAKYGVDAPDEVYNYVHTIKSAIS